MKTLLPKRSDNSSKFDFGRALIISGSRSYTGSVYLAATACARSGVGLVNVLTSESAHRVLSGKFVEVMIDSLDEDKNGYISSTSKNISKIFNYIDMASAVLIGPGLGRSEDLKNLVSYIVKNSNIPIVLDADALNNLKGSVDIFLDKHPSIVISPHAKEFDRLFSLSHRPSDEELINLSNKYNITIVYKEPETRIASPLTSSSFLSSSSSHSDSKFAINKNAGNSALSKGGTGDFLAGLILSFLTQGSSEYDASILAVGILTELGKIAREEMTEYSALPSDLIAFLPRVFKSLLKK